MLLHERIALWRYCQLVIFARTVQSRAKFEQHYQLSEYFYPAIQYVLL